MTPEDLREILHYNAETGNLFWKPRPFDMFKTVTAAKAWNSRFAGKRAFVTKSDGYWRGFIHKRPYRAHRVAWAIAHGEWPDCIDHVNGDRSDNRLENLRSVTAAENSRNIGISKANTSGTSGVSWEARRRKWRATIRDSGVKKHLGYFDTREAAAKCWQDASSDIGFHENHGSRR